MVRSASLFSVLLFAATLLFQVGCGDDVLDPNQPMLRATIDDNDKQTDNVIAQESSTSVIVTGRFSDGSNLHLTLSGIDAPDSVRIDPPTVTAQYTTGSLTSYEATSGYINLKSYDSDGVSGTFELHVEATSPKGSDPATREITKGSFAAKFVN